MIEQIDKALLDLFGSMQVPVLNEIMIFVSSLGNGGILWIAMAIILLCFKKTRKCGLAVALALVIGLIMCNITLKPLIARVRPFDAHEIELLIAPPTDWSFPSGHTTSSFAAAISAGLCLKKKGWLVMIPAVLMAMSRLYLQVHYFSDVLVGAVIGCAAAFVAVAVINRLYQRYDRG